MNRYSVRGVIPSRLAASAVLSHSISLLFMVNHRTPAVLGRRVSLPPPAHRDADDHRKNPKAIVSGHLV
jgi:hypothetical protein